VIQQNSNAEDVALDGGPLAAQKFRRHVERRATDSRSRPGETGVVQILAEAEVQQDNPAPVFTHDVLGFDIAMQ